MILSRLLLQNFRNYSSSDFSFSTGTTFIVGPNTSGKSNIIEAIYLLAFGKSFRTEQDEQMVSFGKEISRVKALINENSNENTKLEVTLAQGALAGQRSLIKKYQINDLPKRRIDFAGNLPVLLFEPSDLDLISGSPGLRREFLDEVLEQTDREYRQNLLTYTKALRQRNALLQRTRETGVRQKMQFSYWDEIIIRTGNDITKKRSLLINALNEAEKELFLLNLSYDSSIISADRLAKYKEAEVASGVTLVGPHRDDILFSMKREGEDALALKSFGSRGQQRLGVLQLKILQLQYMKIKLKEQPILLLDDIFSELDEEHIKHILDVVSHQQTIITTTHREFLTEAGLENPYIIELK